MMMQLTQNRIAESRIVALGVLVAALMAACLLLVAKPAPMPRPPSWLIGQTTQIPRLPKPAQRPRCNLGPFTYPYSPRSAWKGLGLSSCYHLPLGPGAPPFSRVVESRPLSLPRSHNGSILRAET